MSPIRPEERDRYPDDWAAISLAIKERAGWRCECRGECGGVRHTAMVRNLLAIDVGSDTRCLNLHGQPSIWSGSKVVLTTAHLDHTPENCDPSNLRAMCQACHLNYDREHHAATRASRRAR